MVLTMHVLVTGGNGFIGAHVLRQLVEREHAVTCLDVREPSPIAETVAEDVTFVRGDVTDPVDVYDAIARVDPDRVIHLASLLGRASQRDPRRAFTVNVDGTLHVLEAAGSLGVERVVVASSVAAYGDVPEDTERLRESVTQRPRNVYGLTKYAVERLGPTYQEYGEIEFVALEPVHGLGPDRRRGNVEDAAIVKAAVSGVSLCVPRVEEPIEIVAVEDEARTFVRAALADAHALSHDRYLVGTGERVTLTDLVEMVREYVPDAEFAFASRRSDDELERLPPSDTTRIRDDLGWEPSYTIDDAVERYVRWLRENPEKWSFDPEAVPWSTDASA